MRFVEEFNPHFFKPRHFFFFFFCLKRGWEGGGGGKGGRVMGMMG